VDFCGNCGTERETVEQRFCRNCGQPLQGQNGATGTSPTASAVDLTTGRTTAGPLAAAPARRFGRSLWVAPALVAATVLAGGLIWRLTADGSGDDDGAGQASFSGETSSAVATHNLLVPLDVAPKEAFTLHFADLDPKADCATASYCEGTWMQADDTHAVATTYYEGQDGIRYFAHGLDATTGQVTWSVDLGTQGNCLGATSAAVACLMGDPAAPTLRTLSVNDGTQIAEAGGTAQWRTSGATDVTRAGDDLYLTLIPSGEGAGKVLTAKVNADGNFAWVETNDIKPTDQGGDGQIVVAGDTVVFPRATTPAGSPLALNGAAGDPVEPSPAVLATAKDLLREADTNDGSTSGFTAIWNKATNSMQVGAAAASGQASDSAAPLWSEPDQDLVGACGGAFIMGDEQEVVARAPKDGSELWRAQLDGENPQFLCDGTHLVAVTTNGLVALNAANGKPAWNENPTWQQVVSADTTISGKASFRFVVTGQEGEMNSRMFTIYQGG
jgi:outer membrane protein assembly factor BamB